MSFPFFNNSFVSNVNITADSLYRDLTQAFINQQWDNTSAKTPENGGAILEQENIGSSNYNEIEAWLAPIVADTSTGLKYPEDFLKLIFKDINHEVQRGLMYQYNNEYWIVYSYASFDGLPQSVGIRRCNNVLKIIDPQNASVFSIPCCVDYDMLAPTPRVSRYIITPNSHAVVMVQGNADTTRLFTINSRYMLGGRPFKLYAFQNTIKYKSSDEYSSLLYLDLYLDEEHPDDDIVNQIADNGTYNYDIQIDKKFGKLVVGSTGMFSATIRLNDNEVERPVVWQSETPDIISVNVDGSYTVLGNDGDIGSVSCSLGGNSEIFDTIQIEIVSNLNDVTFVVLPDIVQIKQYNTIDFEVMVLYNGQPQVVDEIQMRCSNNNAILNQIDNTHFKLYGAKIGSFDLIYAFNNANPNISGDGVIPLSVVSMI